MNSLRLFGIETEYGLELEGASPHSQLEDAAKLVSHYPFPAFDVWDYSQESARADMRGFVAEKLQTDPQDAQWETGRRRDREEHADRILANGARLYNDHGHPEYATPECSRIMDAVAHDSAGEKI